jgi:hypothetical protein
MQIAQADEQRRSPGAHGRIVLLAGVNARTIHLAPF